MKEFIQAAFPWVLMGIALAILAAGRTKRAKEDAPPGGDGPAGPPGQTPVRQKPDSYMSEGMCLGMCAGVALSSAVRFDLALGISLGMLLGMAVGYGIKKE